MFDVVPHTFTSDVDVLAVVVPIDSTVRSVLLSVKSVNQSQVLLPLAPFTHSAFGENPTSTSCVAHDIVKLPTLNFCRSHRISILDVFNHGCSVKLGVCVLILDIIESYFYFAYLFVCICHFDS